MNFKEVIYMNEPLFSILDFILDADRDQLSQIVQAAVDRYSLIAPDWETAFLSFPKNDPARREQTLRSILQLHDQ